MEGLPMEKQKERSFRYDLADAVKKCIRYLKNGRRWFNHRLIDVYSPWKMAFFGMSVIMIISVILLFIPSYTGLADDGSLSGIMSAAGLGYRAQDQEQTAGAYFVRVYLHSVESGDGVSFHIFLIKIAETIDNWFTSDNLFDVRFLALLYLIFFLPAIYLLFGEILERVRYPSEALFLIILGILIYGDVSYISFFNSLYPDALAIIMLTYILALCLSLQKENSRMNQLSLVGLTFAGVVMTFTERCCTAVVIVLVIFCLRQTMMDEAQIQVRVLAALTAAVLMAAAVVGASIGESRFTQDSKLNAMTSGVLLESMNPRKSLESFGIDSRFELLTDTSSYADYPLVTSGNEDLVKNFYPHYDMVKLGFYYVRHPAAWISLIELGTRAAFNIRRDYIGNYELGSGYAEAARSPWFSAFSNFKMTSAPGTIGYLIVLSISYSALLRKKRTVLMTTRRRSIAVDSFWMAIGTGIVFTTGIVLQSGSSELARYNVIYSLCIDFVTFLFMAEILHRLNFLDTEE